MNDAEEKQIGEGGQKYRALRKETGTKHLLAPPNLRKKREKSLSLLLHYWPLKKKENPSS